MRMFMLKHNDQTERCRQSLCQRMQTIACLGTVWYRSLVAAVTGLRVISTAPFSPLHRLYYGSKWHHYKHGALLQRIRLAEMMDLV